MQEWQPAGPFEERLREAFLAGDMVTCLALLRRSEFALPITEAAAAGDEPVGWAVFESGEQTWLPAYTSVEAMEAATGGRSRHCRVVTLFELAAGWPNARWGLAVNAGLPVHFLLESGTVARLAVPSMSEDKAADPDAPLPVMQKLLAPQEIADRINMRQLRVSGYVHQLADVAHIATPSVLVDALGESDRGAELITDDGSVNMLRWTAVGPQLYRTPFGGIDEETMTAVAGWVIEEPPFVGLGLGRNVDQVIREYKVDGVGLTHGAEIWELGADGQEKRRAILDADRGVWMLVVPAQRDEDRAGERTEIGGDQLESWLQAAHLRLDHWQRSELPEDFPLDFSPASLDRLEALVLARFDNPQDMAALDEQAFLQGAIAYAGETLLRVGGGSWGWQEDTERALPGQPVVLPDERLDTPAVLPIALLVQAAKRRHGGVLREASAALQRRVDAVRAEDPAWTPVKRPTSGFDDVERLP